MVEGNYLPKRRFRVSRDECLSMSEPENNTSSDSQWGGGSTEGTAMTGLVEEERGRGSGEYFGCGLG